MRKSSLSEDTLLRMLVAGRAQKRPFVDLCDGLLYLRNVTEGHRTRKEWVTDLLRDRVKYGEQITTFMKERIFRDRYRQTASRTQPPTR